MLTFSIGRGRGMAESPGGRGQQGGKDDGQPRLFQTAAHRAVKKQGEQTFLEIKPELAPALKGLEDFSHLWVFYWFHENDRRRPGPPCRCIPAGTRPIP